MTPVEHFDDRRWTVVVVGGGALSDRAVAAASSARNSAVIAADSGLDHAIAAGIEPTVLVGDLDSISAAGRMWAYAHGLTIDEYPAAKDLTDTELALSAAAAAPADGLLVVGGVGDRLDHLLGVLLALGGSAAAVFADVRAIIGDNEFVVVHAHHRHELRLEAGRTFSVLALHGGCRGVYLHGARWELDGADLAATEARGLSNVANGTITVALDHGTLTVVIP